MARRHGLEAGAEYLAEIGGAVDREAEQASGDRIEREADERPAVIEQEKLDQERRAADDLDDSQQRITQPAAAVAPPDGDQEAEDRGADHADDPSQQGYPERPRKFGHAAYDQIVSKFIAAPSGRSVRTASRPTRSAS